MVTGMDGRCGGLAAVLLGGLLATAAFGQAAFGQSEAAAPRSVYQRRSANDVGRGNPAPRPSDRRSTDRGLGVGSPSAKRAAAAPRTAEPRLLPQTPGQQARRLPRASTPRGYSSKGLFPAGQSLADSNLRSAPRPMTPPLAGPSQGVVPAFFPAPLAAVEAGASAEATPVAPAPALPLDAAAIAAQLITTQPGEHPLLPAIRWARQTLEKLDTIQDYSCVMVKRERIDGTLGDQEYMSVKIRHEPFSVYLGFVKPAKVKGQEAIYVRGRNNGEMQAHGNGMRKLFGTVSLKPDSYLAMAGNRYPITEMGLRRLVERLIEVGENDAKFGECEVKASPKKINGREVVCLQVTHPLPRKEFLFHIAKIYIDTQNNLPMRYESYDWPAETGGVPPLMEEYTYLNLKLNNRFGDKDFDVGNPAYQFK